MRKTKRDFLIEVLMPFASGSSALAAGYLLASNTWLGMYNWFYAACLLLYIFLGWTFWLPHKAAIRQHYRGQIPLSIELRIAATCCGIGGAITGLFLGSLFIN